MRQTPSEKFLRKMVRMERARAERIFTIYMTPYNGGEVKKVEVASYTREYAIHLANQGNEGYIATASRVKKVLV